MNNFKNRVTDNTYLSHLNPAEDSLFYKYDSFTDIKLWTHHSDTTKGYSLLNHTVLPGQPNYVYNTTQVVGGISKAVSIIYDPSELNIQDEPTVILLAKRLDLKQYIYKRTTRACAHARVLSKKHLKIYFKRQKQQKTLKALLKKNEK